MKTPLTVTPQQAAQLTGYSVSSIRRFVADGQLVATQPRRRVLIDYTSVVDFLAGKTMIRDAPPVPPPSLPSFRRRKRLTPDYDAFS